MCCDYRIFLRYKQRFDKANANPKTNRCTAAYSTGVYRTEPYTNNLFSRPHSGRKDKL